MVPRVLVLSALLAAGCGSSSEGSPPLLKDWRPVADAAREAEAGSASLLDAEVDSDVHLPPTAAPWTLYACYYGPPAQIPPLTQCTSGFAYVTCLINGQYIGFCDASAQCHELATAPEIWVCPAGFAANNPACTSVRSKYPGSYVYDCGDAGGPTGS